MSTCRKHCRLLFILLDQAVNARPEPRICFHFVIDVVDGVDHGGVFSAAEHLADRFIGKIRHFLDHIHGDIPGHRDIGLSFI